MIDIEKMDNNENFPERRYPFSLFLIGFIMNIFLRFWWLSIPSAILLIVGIFVEGCSYIGLALLGTDIIFSFIEQMRIRHTMLSDSENEQFRKLQDAVSREGEVFENIRDFLKDTVEGSIDEEKVQKNDLIVDMCDNICQKCEYGEDVGKLNEHERVFFVAQILEQEVNNGGFSQFFYNSSGDFSNEVVDVFVKIGALKTAEICRKALAVFGGKVPTDRNEREEMFDDLDCDDILNECDDAFYDYEDDLEALNYAYIMKHREFFDGL